MTSFDETPLDNPVWYALTEHQGHVAVDYGGVKFYHPDYAPFGAFIPGGHTSEAIEKHARLIRDFFIVGEMPQMPEQFKAPVQYIGLQMIVYKNIDHPVTETIIELTDAHYDDLIRLIKLVYPEYFKSKTQKLGQYYGIYKGGQLVAAAGERMQTHNFIEISAIITHPGHTGKGYAKQLITHTADRIFKKGKIPFLHVDETNTNAIRLYLKLGFKTRRRFSFWKISV
ncbi:GNAT family N-acetyltransferase [Aestuariivivens sediminicola]|uniref:GNAT family N-acetyltransferase n=1 Tax=Aestuariivivens sediminicola TaxID=2913560 RepID=UPI001F569F67|nr:GNAT family N-acetyltransferase [Aestuariivivens sediminicola]